MAVNKNKLVQIENEIKKGKISKAISRLEGLIFFNPNEQKYREKLGEIYYSINWLEKAGQYWYLTDRSPIKEQAIKIFEENCGNSATQILTVLKFRGIIDYLPEEVKHIYISLEEESLSTNGYVPKFNSKNKNIQYSYSKNNKLFEYGCIIFFVILFILVIVGLISIVKWIF